MNKIISVLFMSALLISCAHNGGNITSDDKATYNGTNSTELPQISFEGEVHQEEGDQEHVANMPKEELIKEEAPTNYSTEEEVAVTDTTTEPQEEIQPVESSMLDSQSPESQFNLVTFPPASELIKSTHESKQGIKPAIDNKVDREQPIKTKKTVKSRKITKPILLAKVPANPVTKGDTLLNRYYIIRDVDSPESLSLLFYGVSEKSDDIKKWNSNVKWRPGEILLYASPILPSDTVMLSFYEERNVTIHEYSVSQSDTLPLIAKKWHDTTNTWKEIAITNRISPSETLVPGRILILYPKDLSRYSFDITSNKKLEEEKTLAYLNEKMVEQQEISKKIEQEKSAPKFAEPTIGSVRLWKYVAIVALIFFIILFLYNKRRKNLNSEDDRFEG